MTRKPFSTAYLSRLANTTLIKTTKMVKIQLDGSERHFVTMRFNDRYQFRSFSTQIVFNFPQHFRKMVLDSTTSLR